MAVHAIGYVGNSAEEARSEFFPAYRAVFGPIGQKAGWPPMSRGSFDAMTGQGQALVVGDEEEVAEKLCQIHRVLGGVSRVCLQMTVGPLARPHRLGTITRLGNVSSAMEKRYRAAPFQCDPAGSQRTNPRLGAALPAGSAAGRA